MIYDDKTTRHWVTRQDGDGWVCTKTFDDGSVCVYPFKTLEWAQLCRDSMNRLDDYERQRMWGTSTITWAVGAQYATTCSLRELTMTHFDLENRTIFAMDHNRQVVKFDVPAIIYLWLKTTWIPKAWKRLMWGEKGKQ